MLKNQELFTAINKLIEAIEYEMERDYLADSFTQELIAWPDITAQSDVGVCFIYKSRPDAVVWIHPGDIPSDYKKNIGPFNDRKTDVLAKRIVAALDAGKTQYVEVENGK